MTAQPDIYARRFVADGTEAVVDDVNFTNGMLSARLFDQLLGQLVMSDAAVDPEFPAYGAADATAARYAIALHAARAMPVQSPAAFNKIRISPGTLLQKVAAAGGAEETLLAFTFDGSSTWDVSIANGDATNPRVDLIQMQLSLVTGDDTMVTFDSATPPAVNLIAQSEPTTRRVNCTLSVKQGTPAASPQYPDPDAGFVAVAGVVVNANYAGTVFSLFDISGTNATLHDQRMPIRTRSHVVSPRSFVARREPPKYRVDAMSAVSTAGGPAQSAGQSWGWGTNTGRLVYPLDIRPGQTIAGYSVYVDKASASGTLQAQLFKFNATTNTETPISVGNGLTGGPFGAHVISETTPTGWAAPVGPSANEYFYIVVTGGGTTGDISYHAEWYPGGAWTDGGAFEGDDTGIGESLVSLDKTSPTLRILPPTAQIGRVVGLAVEASGFASTSGVAFLGTITKSVGATQTAVNAVDVSAAVAPSSGSYKRRTLVLDVAGAAHTPAAGPTVLPSATGKIGVPVWTSGLRAPYPEQAIVGGPATPTSTQVVVVSNNASQRVGPATWFIAEGL